MYIFQILVDLSQTDRLVLLVRLQDWSIQLSTKFIVANYTRPEILKKF